MGTQLKRGISDVVTTVLIILLALAAVVILWTFLRGEIQKGSEEIAGASECLGLVLIPKSCVVSKLGTNVSFSVEFVSGDVVLNNITAIIDVSPTSRLVNQSTKVPLRYGVESGNIINPALSNAVQGVTKVSLVGEIKAANTGKLVNCQQSQSFVCTVA